MCKTNFTALQHPFYTSYHFVMFALENTANQDMFIILYKRKRKRKAKMISPKLQKLNVCLS